MFIVSPRSKINRRKASLRAKAAKMFLNGEKNDRKMSSNLSNSLSRELKYDTLFENKPIITENIQNCSIFEKSSRFNLIYDIDKIEMEERKKVNVQRDEKVEKIEKEIKRIKKELHKKMINEEKEKEKYKVKLKEREKNSGNENDDKNKNENKNETKNGHVRKQSSNK